MKLFTAVFCALVLWFLQSVIFERFWRTGLKAALTFNCSHVSEGECTVLRETVTNAKALPLPVLHVKFQMGKHLVFTSAANFKITDQNYRSDIFSCMPWQEIRRNLQISCQKRGYYTISQVQLVTYDLFFSSHMAASLPVDASLYVFPREIPFDRLKLPFSCLCGQISALTSLTADPFEIQSVRPYQSYDPYRCINWKATARTGELKVNVYAPTSSLQVMFLMDTDCGGIWKDEDLTEEALRLCGSYSRLLIGQGIPVSVVSNGTDCLTGQKGCIEAGAGKNHGEAVMELLARIRTCKDEQSPMEEILKDLARPSGAYPSMEGGSTVFILISSKQRDTMVQAFDFLCRQRPGCQWILPHRPGQKHVPEPAAPISVFPWEVPYDYSHAS